MPRPNFKKVTFLCMQQLTNFPYIEEDFDALTNYELLSKVVEYLNKVIANENIQNESIIELYNSFNNLKNYVDNYFENLDVQDEINNKLDEMVEAGTLQEIIANYLNSKAIFGFDNVADMKNATNLINGSYARTLGFYSKNDGGSALYKIKTIDNTVVIDNMTKIALASTNTLYAELINENDSINIKQLGAKTSSSNTDDIKTYLEKAYDLYNEIIIPSGEYYLSEFNPDSEGFQYKTIKGIGSPKIYTSNGFIFNGSNSGVYSERVNKVTIDGINFYGSGRSNNNRIGIGITFEWFGQCYIKNCYFAYFTKGLNCINGSEFILENSIFLGNDISLYCVKTSDYAYTDLDAFVVNDCFISNSEYGAILDSTRGVSFNNCVIASSSQTENEYGVVIKNTYSPSNNINFVNCEFENNRNELPSIQSGYTTDTGLGCQTVNIINCKFTMFANNAIDILNGTTFNITNCVFSLIYPDVIYIRSSVSDTFNLQLLGNYYSLPQYIEDERDHFVGGFIPAFFKRLNFYPDMSRSIFEFVPSVTPTYDSTNKNVSFSSNGFIQYKLDNNNYNKDGICILVKGINIAGVRYLKSGSTEVDVGGFTIQTLENNENVKLIFIKDSDITHVRIYFNNNAVINRVEIYGSKSNALPIAPNPTIDNVNFIGSPQRGDTFVFSNSSATLSIGTWNGTQFIGN